MDRFVSHPVIHWQPSSVRSVSHKLVGEAPLSIQVQGHPFSVGMRTPGNEIAQAAGFCLAEGIVEEPDDIEAIDISDKPENKIVEVRLTVSRWEKVAGMVTGRREGGDAAFGQNAEQAIEALCRRVSPLTDDTRISVEKGLECLDSLNRHQPLRSKTHATHATAIYSRNFDFLTAAEDVGRHNGLDKAIGALFLERRLEEAGMLVLSSRISFELVQKAVRARIPVIFSVSRPTALAVRLASRLNMTLACLAKGGGGYVFCGQHRLGM